MIKKQFNNHKWKVNDTVYLTTQVEFAGNRFMNRVLQTTVSSIRTICDETENGTSTFISLFLNIPESQEQNEKIDALHYPAGITSATCEDIFLNKTSALKSFQKKKVLYRDAERLAIVKGYIYDSFKKIEKNVESQREAYRELLRKFNIEE